MPQHVYVNYVLTDETQASGNSEATKKSSRELDGCEYHYILLFNHKATEFSIQT
jgi:hypothetical protein